MKRFFAKLALFLVPVLLYLALFVAFEPNNYFGIKPSGSDNNAIARIRAYVQNPLPSIILGDSRMAQFEAALVASSAGEPFANLAYGGAGLAESIDEFYFLYRQNPNIRRVVLGVSFYTLNVANSPANRMKTMETQLTNPAAYVFNLEYNINMLTVLKDTLVGAPALTEAETAEHTPDEYVDETGAPLPFRRDLMAYAQTITPKCERFAINADTLSALLELADFCQANGIALTIVLPPMDESVRTLVCQRFGIDAAMQPVLAQLKASGATVLDYEWENAPDFADTQFYDGFHLDTVHGLTVWTEMLFSEVA